jgi:hypothetical protein
MTTPSSNLRAQLVGALIQWLEAQRVLLAESWSNDGLSPTVSVERVTAQRWYERVAEREAKWYLRFSTENVEVSRFRMMSGVSIWWKATIPPPTDLFIEAYGDDAVEHGILDGVADEESTAVAAFLGRLCSDYLTALTDATSPALDKAERVVESYLQFVESEEIVETVQLPIGGVATPTEAIDAGDVGIILRALTNEELGELNKEMLGLRGAFEPSVLPVGMGIAHERQLGLESCMLTVSERVSRRRPAKSSWRASRVILALQLLGFPICGRGCVASWTEPGPRMGLFAEPPVMPRMPIAPETGLAKDDLIRAAQLAERIPVGCFHQPNRRDEIALRRFAIAESQEDQAEAIIDYMIALEGLLVPTLQGEVSFRLCLNGARYIADTSDERLAVFRDLKKLYDTRSRLVHGSPSSGLDDPFKWKQKARDLAARGLRKAALHGWPSAEDFATAALS